RPAPSLSAHKRPRIVTVASMYRVDKGHHDLLLAAAEVKRRGVNAEWLLVSDGDRRPLLEAQASRLGLPGTVRFLGSRRDVPALLKRSELLVHPSLSEGLPNAVLEAMAAGCAVVATRVGGVPELVLEGVTGCMVPPHSPSAMAHAIVHLMRHDTLRERMGR